MIAKVAFEITDEHIHRLSGRKLDREQVEEVLELIEADIILREDMQASIRGAIAVVTKKKRR